MSKYPDIHPYPAYKPSGIDRLGDIPAHWEVRRLKDWVSINRETLPETTDPDYQFRYVEIGAVGAGAPLDEPAHIRFANAPSRARRIVRTGDTIVSTVRTYLKAVWFADELNDDLICSTGFAVLTPREEAAPKFVSYLARSDYFTDMVTAESVGIAYPAIAESRLSSLHIPVPPLAEQRAIARYLDRADADIRRAVSAKRRLSELLTEQRQAVIHHAVTRGLDPNAPLKHSGVEWLGDVPAHWEVRRLKTITTLNPSKSEARQTLSDNTLVVFLPMEKVGTDGNIDESELKQASEVWNGFTYFRRHDVLVAKITPCFENGKGTYLNSLRTDVGFGSTEFHVIRAMPAVLPLFIYYHTITQEFRGQGTDAMTGAAGQQRVPLSFVANYPIPLPPRAEQAAIVRHLDKATADIDAAIDNAQRQIDLLREYRARLIADAVTGRVDARGAAEK